MNEEILFIIAKFIAESDSIGERWSYCPQYNKGDFEEELENNQYAWTYRYHAEELYYLLKDYLK